MNRDSQIFCFGSYELDGATEELRKHGLRLKVEDQPVRLLVALVSRPGEVVTREEMKEILWPKDTFVEFDLSLNRAVNKLRAALGDSASNPRYIETLPRRGYRFIAPVTVHSVPAASVPTEQAPAPVAATWRRKWLFVPVALVVVLAIAAFVARRAAVEPVSIAVLPFQNLSGDGSQDYLADAITDQLIGALCTVRSWRVVSRTSSMRYKKTQQTLAGIGSELRVNTFVEGSVARAGGRVKLSVRVIRMPNESTVFQAQYDEDAGQLPVWQAGLVRRVAAAIRTSIGPEEDVRLARRARVVDPELHALYLRGRVFVAEPEREAAERGIHALERVVAKDPQHAQAWAAMALGWFGLSSIYVAPREAMPKAKAAAQKAVEIDPELDEAHALLGLIHVFYEWNWDEAAKYFRKALELNPNSFTATRGLVMLDTANGDLEQAALHAQRALQLDPMSLWASFQETLVLAFAKKYEQAERSASRALAWDPNFGLLRSAMGISQVMRGDLRGLPELERAAKTQRVPTTIAFLAHGYAAAGRPAEGNRLVDELVAMAGEHYVCPFEVAQAMVSLNRIDEAFRWMQKGVEDRADCMIALRSEPWLEPMRSDARYAGLVRAVGFRTGP